jgi:uncharacterized protein (DUF1684 family)
MNVRLACGVVLAGALVGCARERWPDPPAIDQSQYQKEYEEWRNEQRETAAYALRLIGIWPLDEGETPFGADASLPIVLPPGAAPTRAGVFSRAGEKITVTPSSAPLRLEDGSAVTKRMEIDDGTVLAFESIRLQVVASPPSVFVSAWDEEHPALENLGVEAYPVDARWRVAARFDAFDAPKPVRIADTRGGFADMTAPGQLVFRLNGEESRLTVLGEPGGDRFFVMFKDATNGSTTYGGYRILAPAVVGNGEWTVLDFNLARNPPCAYSRYTLCPLPPRENRLQMAVEAGAKRHPTAQGFSE